MAFSGHTSPQVVINSTANANPYTGSFTVGGTSDLVVLFVSGWSGTTADPATWTVTLDGSAITQADKAFTTLAFGGAIYELTGLSAGAHTLSVSYVENGRACQALAFVISGHDTTTPIAGRSYSTGYSTDVATLGFTRTTTRDGNLLLSMLTVRETIAGAEFALSGGTLINTSATGTTDTSDITSAYGYHEVATAGSATDTYTWTDIGRCHVGFVEVNIATGGGGVTGTSSGSADVTATASGAVSVAGATSGAADVTGAASGAVTVQGAATGSADVTGTATGSAISGRTGTAAGAASVTGAASGIVAVRGTASGQAGVTGASAGAVLIRGQSSGAADVTGSAAGSVGFAGGINGAASGAAGVSGAATGLVLLRGAGSGAAGVTGLSTGAVIVKGAASGVAVVTGAASGLALSPITGIAAGLAGVSGFAIAATGALSLRRAATAAQSANSGNHPDANGGTLIRTSNGGTIIQG